MVFFDSFFLMLINLSFLNGSMATLYLFVSAVLIWFLFLSSFTSTSFMMSGGTLIDEVSLLLVFITVFVMLLSYISILHFSSLSTSLTFWALLISCFFVFSTSNLFILYMFYEAALVPISYIIIKWGIYPDRSESAIFMLLFTSFFTFPFMILLFFLNLEFNSFSYFSVVVFLPALSDFMVVWIIFSFSVKLPVYGLHYWLPMAHVEAPTFGSMILAGLLLKLGGCGLIRFYPLLVPSLNFCYTVFISYIIISIIMCSFVCVVQSDMKRLVAYSSVLHMTIIPLLILLGDSLSVKIVLMLSIFHGLASPFLFYLVGMVYDVFKTRSLILLKSLVLMNPLLSFICVLGLVINVPIPPMPGFVSEFLTFIILTVNFSFSISFLLMVSLVLLVFIYSLLWFHTLLFSYSGRYMTLSTVPLYSCVGLVSSFLLSFSFFIIFFLF